MKLENLRDFNKLRKQKYYKDEQSEDFLLTLNKTLQAKEISDYQEFEERFPSLFIAGIPRSGTTVMAQLIAYAFDIGYINNFMARFWLAPVTGIKLSKIILGDNPQIDFSSEYAATKAITDIHEFGYFWRYWLNKDTVAGHVNLEKTEKQINWKGLNDTLLNIQHAFNKAVCMKNIFGAYHMEKITALLPKSVFIYIERDPLDNAVSILEARKQFFDDINTWWSIIPPEYEKLKNLHYIKQIAGQVYYLNKFFNSRIRSCKTNQVIRIQYKDMCHNPAGVIKQIHDACRHNCNYDIPVKKIPEKFMFKTYHNTQLKKQFENSINTFINEDRNTPA
jgi:hypothetical protein